MAKTANDVLKLIKSKKIEFVDLRFCDIFGRWQHTSFPSAEIDAGTFKDGMGFDGSSIRGWQAINNSDMIILPDPTTAVVDPFMAHPTLSLICDFRIIISRSFAIILRGRVVPIQPLLTFLRFDIWFGFKL